MRSTAKRNHSADDGLLDQYLRDISAYPLISREEEVALAIRSREGDEEALGLLVRANLRFVVSVAKKYQHQGVSLADLINEGNLGLIRAARRFDETKGIKFISYGVWWIRQAIFQALAEQSRIVRVPLNRSGELNRMARRAAQLIQELGREPTNEEIAEEMEITEEEVAKTRAYTQVHISLDQPLNADDDYALIDRIPDDEGRAPDEDTIEKALIETVHNSLLALKPRESKVIHLYFGLEGGEPLTLDAIGELMGVTRERVRQIKDRALLRLRHTSSKRALESFLG